MKQEKRKEKRQNNLLTSINECTQATCSLVNLFTRQLV